MSFPSFAEVSSAYDFYKGMARSKRKGKVVGKSSQPTPKKTRVDEPTVEVPSVVSIVEIVETPPFIVTSPPLDITKEPKVDVPEVPSPSQEPESEDVARVFASVIQMTADRVQKLAKHKKYVKAASSFPSYNIG